ncbi:cytochrome c peroxidase [Polyangium aurulentum]|uniref:cytochrome c peroxidase n=1 Tax=Polyangium aurulentum TaxID=2567896 RepID=UPI0010AE8558|nr:cytochrome c peroxidase [Polyangium aurulentum]UQA62567.1 protein kinase [Polyangium aurulentum]
MDTPHPDVPRPGDIVAGKYRIEGTLGQGGTSVVLAAEHMALRQPVALKLLLPRHKESTEALERFLREARATASLQNQHVVRVLDAGQLETGEPYLAMERLVGRDLQEVLHARGFLQSAEAVDRLLEACEAIAEAHARGIVHRDLKPANLFLARGADGVELVKVLDFGLSKWVRADGVPVDSLTDSREIVGSIPYMAPEQVRGLKWADARADIWALGVILYELITGQRPFEACSTPQCLLKILEAPPVPLDAWGVPVSVGIDRVILSCLEKDRAQRPQTVAELALALEPFGTSAARASVERICRYQAPDAPCPPQDDIDAEEPPSERASTFRRNETPKSWGSSDGLPRVRTSASRSAAPQAPSDALAPAPEQRLRGFTPVLVGAMLVSALLALTLSRVAPRLAIVSSEIAPERLTSFAPLPTERMPPPDAATAAQIRLGRLLFHDPRLSKNGNVSCTSCHPLETWGADRRKLSRGSDDQEPPRNTLSIYNLDGFFALLWDGRKDNLVDQAKEVLQSPRAMAATPGHVEATLRASEGYTHAFAQAFPDQPQPVTFDNVARSLAAFEATLFTRSRWDRFLEGDKTALSDEEKAGFNRFVEIGCITCHFGPNVGATMYQKAGLVKPWPDTKDRGRYEVTRRYIDWMVFRVPSLRNVAETGPYFHDGSVSSLEEAVKMMGRHQLGQELSDRDARLITRWLASLTGEIPQRDIELDEASRAIMLQRDAP